MSHDILLVDDDPGAIQAMSRMLAGVGRQRFATSGDAALRVAREATPDLILLDAEMPGMSGFQVCEAMRDDAALREVPVIFVTSHGEPEAELAGLDLGAVDYITKPAHEQLLLARVRQQLRTRQRIQALRESVTIDAVTGQTNRRAFLEHLDREWRRCRRADEALALLCVQVDHFGRFIGRHGEVRADECLRRVACALRSVVQRPADVVARFDEDSFALLLPHTRRAGAEHVAHRVLDAVEALSIAHALSPSARHVTVSVGATCHDDESPCWAAPSFAAASGEPIGTSRDLLEAAQKALAAARLAGHAQAWCLDMAHLEAPTLAREVDPAQRPRQLRRAVEH